MEDDVFDLLIPLILPSYSAREESWYLSAALGAQEKGEVRRILEMVNADTLWLFEEEARVRDGGARLEVPGWGQDEPFDGGDHGKQEGERWEFRDVVF